ncbi:MAG: hypothetical protein JRC99_05110 [Deltaproteobacteria bacterium]|nr:hypothetical protein [Deltaproteobacteria bacterium]
MSDMTKSQKKHLRQLAGQCYEKEMTLVLESLYEDFKKWEKSEITPWDLNDKIHQYHDGTARELYKLYEGLNDPRVALAQAVAKGIIKIEDVPENCRPLLTDLIDFYQNEI